MMTKDKALRLFDYDPASGHLRRKVKCGARGKKGEFAGTTSGRGYVRITVEGRQYMEHRLVWLIHHGEFPRILDHINRNREDNRIENLRECHESENAANAAVHSTNTSGYRGVSFDKSRNRWEAKMRMVIDGRSVRRKLGLYKSAEEAAIHYNLHMLAHFKEFALLNKIDTPLGQILGMS